MTRKIKTSVSIFALFFGLGLTQAALGATKGGGADIGGGDLVSPARGSAWFLGFRGTIRACLEVAPDFGHSPETLKGMIRTGFATWDHYYGTKYKSPADLVPGDEGAFLRGLEYEPARHVTFLPSCAGQADLVFYFGVSNDEVAAYRSRFDSPAAYAVRQSYDLRAGWSQGFIWVAKPSSLDRNRFPDFSRPELLQILLTHELGRVWGAGSHTGTITDDKLVNHIKFRENDPEAIRQLGQIDHFKELVPCFTCDARYSGIGPQDPGLAKLLTGKAEFKRVYFEIDRAGENTLVFEQADGTRRYPINRSGSHSAGSTVLSSPSVFLAVKYDTEGRLNSVGADVAGATYQGRIEAFDRKLYGVIVERNLDTLVRILLIDADSDARELFRGTRIVTSR